MSHADTSAGYERRQFFRVEDRLVLAYRPSDAAALDALLERLQTDADNGLGLGSVYEVLLREAEPLLLQLGELPTPALAYLRNLEHRLELIAGALLLHELGGNRAPRHVSLSAGGLQFECERELFVDTWLELRFILPGSREGIVAGARVARCEDIGGQTYPWRIAAEFTHLLAADRQTLVRHVMSCEARELRARQYLALDLPLDLPTAP